MEDTFSLAWKLTVFTLKLAWKTVSYIITLALFLIGSRQSKNEREKLKSKFPLHHGLSSQPQNKMAGAVQCFFAALISSIVLIFVLSFLNGFVAGILQASIGYSGRLDFTALVRLFNSLAFFIWLFLLIFLYGKFKDYFGYSDEKMPRGNAHKSALVSGLTEEKENSISENDTSEKDLLLGQNTSLPFENRMTHMYCVGKTGSGKSKAMQYWLTQDIEAGRGCAFIDAHGDVVDDYLASLAKKFIEKGIKLEDVEKQPRMEDLIIIDPTDPDFAVGINPLETYGTFTPTQMGDILADAIKKMWGFEKGEAGRMEEILANTGHVLAKNGLTLMEADPFLTDEENYIQGVGRRMKPNELRQTLLKNVDNTVVKNFWEKIYPGLAEHEELVDPGKRRLRKFIGDERIADIIGQKEKTLNIREAMDNKRIILCKIPIGKMLDKGSFFGALLVSLFQQAAMSRDKDESNPPFFLYIDEFHEFVSLAFEKILSGARKYGLHFILAHQYKRQVDQNIQDVIIKNTKAIMAFDIDAEDAEIMAKEFFEITCRMIRDTRRSFRLVNLGGLQIPYFEETNDYYSKDEEIQLNANEFKKLQPRQFIVMQEGYEMPQGDITADVPEIKKDERIKEYVQKIREISNKRWGLSKKQIREEILQRRKGLENPANYLKEFLSEKKNDDTKTETKTG